MVEGYGAGCFSFPTLSTLQSAMQYAPDSNRSTPAQFRSKLGTYATGVAIGSLALGTIFYQKHKAIKRQQAAAQTIDNTTPAATPKPGTTP